MENASKALIIAGAILISILIIGLGVFIYQKAKGAMDDSINLDSQKVQSINAKFEDYEGKGRSVSDVKSLMDLVRTHNNQYPDAKITVKQNDLVGNAISTITAIKGNVVSDEHGYIVKITEYYDSGAYKGLISAIEINQ